jgi:hypothetical protein
LIWLCPAGAVIVISTEQNKVTIPKLEVGKGWQNSNTTIDHCPREIIVHQLSVQWTPQASAMTSGL